MHLAVQLHAGNHVPAIGLQRAAVVVQMHSRNERDEAIREPAHEVPADRRVLPRAAPSRAHVETFAEPREQQRNVFRIVLQVRIHRNDDLARCEIEARLHGRGLSEVAAEVNDLEARMLRCHFVEQCGTAVGAAVVDEDDFPRLAQLLQRREESFAQRGQAFFFVEDGNRDRYGGGIALGDARHAYGKRHGMHRR